MLALFKLFWHRQLLRKSIVGPRPANTSAALERALLAALLRQRTPLLNRLVRQVGPQAFANTLAHLDKHQMHTALRLLDHKPRSAVSAHLPAATTNGWMHGSALEQPKPLGRKP